MNLLASLSALTVVGDDIWSSNGEPSGDGPVSAGLLLAEMTEAVRRSSSRRRLLSIRSVFAVVARRDQVRTVIVRPVSVGRVTDFLSVDIRVGDRICASALAVVTDASHEPTSGPATDPSPPIPSAPLWRTQSPGIELRVEDAEAIWDGALGSGPVTAYLQAPLVGPETSPAVIAYYSCAFLIAAAVRELADVGLRDAHGSLVAAPVAHTLTFHRPVDLTNWRVMEMANVSVGGGFCSGLGRVTYLDEAPIATFSQDSVFRPRSTTTAA